jgi:hypothetical protein
MNKSVLKNFFLTILSLAFVFLSTTLVSAAIPQPPEGCINFEDVQPGNTFYPFVHVLGCHGAVSGYACGGAGEPCNSANDPYFRPGNPLTRAQGAQLVAVSAGFSEAAGPQMFEDIAPGSTFYDPIQRLSHRSIIAGYPCGGDGEACVPPNNRPYFRQNSPLTRAQLAKMTATAAGYTDSVSGQTFEDIAPGSTFYDVIERLSKRHIVNGYPCGGAGEACVPPTNRPYFRQNAQVTRQQAAQMVALAFYPDEVSPNPTATPRASVTPGGSVTPGSDCSKRPMGDADCNGVVNNIDYLYYVSVVNGGTVPPNVSADFNNDNETGTKDREIIIATLGGNNNGKIGDGTPAPTNVRVPPIGIGSPTPTQSPVGN